MRDYFFSEIVIFLLGVLRIQNAKLFISETNTAEEISTIRTLETVLCIAERNTRRTKFAVIHAVTARGTLIDKFAILTPGIEVHAGLARE